VEGVNFSLICAVILKAMIGLSTVEEGWVLRVKFGFRSEDDNIVVFWISGSLEIDCPDTL
jgi:hypothetical protein